jgi:hypothetical protein
MKKLSDKLIKKHIAALAAEIMIEEGMNDYLFAKKKAAKILNYLDQMILPSNQDIDVAIREYQSTYSSNAPNDFDFFKPLVVKLMSSLKKFNPHITGILQEGRTSVNQKILINLFTDDVKEIEYFLLSQNIQFKTKDGQKLDYFIAKYVYFYEDIETELIVSDLNDLRVNNKNTSLMKKRGLSIDEFKKVQAAFNSDLLSS